MLDNTCEYTKPQIDTEIANLGYRTTQTETKLFYNAEGTKIYRQMFTYNLNQTFTNGTNFLIQSNFPVAPSKIINISGIFVRTVTNSYFADSFEPYVVQEANSLYGIEHISTFTGSAVIRVFIDYVA